MRLANLLVFLTICVCLFGCKESKSERNATDLVNGSLEENEVTIPNDVEVLIDSVNEWNKTELMYALHPALETRDNYSVSGETEGWLEELLEAIEAKGFRVEWDEKTNSAAAIRKE